MPIEVTKDDIRHLRIIAGFVIAPAVPAVPLLLLCIVDRNAWVLAAMLAQIGYMAAIFFGLPIFFCAYGRGIRSLRACMLGEFVIGTAPGPLIGLMMSAPQLSFNINTSWFGALYGLLAAVAFWFIAIRKSVTSTPPGTEKQKTR